MPDRQDILPTDSSRLHTLSGAVLRPAPDEVLQTLVDQAARKLDAPIALVSLVLDTIQFFRAHHGLPPELAAVPATSRETSFAQFVVLDEAPIAVADFATDTRLPKALVQQYGLGAYLGVPLRIGGRVSGALEVFDRRPRVWRLADRARLLSLADRVEDRLAVLARQGLDSDPIEPAFENLRDQIVPLQVAVIEARVAALELEVLTALTGEASPDQNPSLAPAIEALGLVQSRLSRATLATSRILDAFGRLRRDALSEVRPVQLVDLADAADAVARPLTSQVGGVRWRLPEEPCPVAVAEPIGIAVISTALVTLVGLLLSRMDLAPINARTQVSAGVVRISFESEAMERRDGLAVLAALSRLGVHETMTRVELTDDEVSIMLPMYSRASA